MTSEGLRFDYDSTSGTGDPNAVFDIAKYSNLTGKTALTGKDGSYVVFKVKTELTDGDFELFTQKPAAGDSGKSSYIQNGQWQYIVVDMTGTTFVTKDKLTTMRIDWASLYVKKDAYMIISEIAFFEKKADAYAHAGIPENPEASGLTTSTMTFPANGSAATYVTADNASLALVKNGGVNAVEINPTSATVKVNIGVRELAAIQKAYPAQKRYIAIRMKTVDNAACTVNLTGYSDLTGKVMSFEIKADLYVDETGWQGVYFDLDGHYSDYASISKIMLRFGNLTRNQGKVYIGDVVITDDLNVALETCGLSEYKLNNSNVHYEDPMASSKLTAKDEDASLKVWFDHSTEKAIQNQFTPKDVSGYTISMAKNESENAQYFIAPSRDMNLVVTIDEFDDGHGHTLTADLTYEYYHNVIGVMRPDALLHIGDSIAVKAGNVQAFMIRVTTKSNTPAGTYNSVIHVYDIDADKEIKRSPIAVKVYNFSLPTATTLRTAFALWANYISSGYPAGGDGYDSEEWNKVIQNYYEFFLDYRINVTDLPYGMTSGRGIAYMQDERINTARWSVRDYSVWTDLQNDGYTEKPMWLSKIIYYPGEVDEPRTEQHFKTLIQVANQIKSIDPDYRMVIPLERDLELMNDGTVTNINKSDTDSVGMLLKYTNIYCPKLDAFTPRALSVRGGATFLQSVAQDKKYGVYLDRVREGVKNGGELWAYICINPTQPYVNWQINSDGTEAIVSLWQMKQLGVTGMLYWAVNVWKASYWRTSAPMENNQAGDGMLIYSGHIEHSLYPVPTIRLESIRDGIEDYEMLTMLENKLGSAALDNMLRKVCTSVLTYTNDDDYLHAVRVQLYEALEAAYN